MQKHAGLVVPYDSREIIELGGAVEAAKHSRISFAPEASHYLRSLSSGTNIFFVLAAGALELGHPIISGAVEERSAYTKDTWNRIHHTTKYLANIALGDDAVAEGTKIRDVHNIRQIPGLDQHGNAVLATHPYAYAQGWLPIVWMMEQTMLSEGASEEEMEEWYLETLIAFQCQSVSDEFVPKNYADFRSAFDEYLSQIMRTESIERIDREGIDPVPLFSGLWRGPLKYSGDRLARAITATALPEQAREALGSARPSRSELFVVGAMKQALCIWSAIAPDVLTRHPHVSEALASGPLERMLAVRMTKMTERMLQSYRRNGTSS